MGTFLNKAFWLIGFGLSILLILACCAFFISIPALPMVDALSIAVPGLIITNLLLLIFWTIKRSAMVIAPLSGLVLALVGFGIPRIISPSHADETTGGLKVMSYNVRGFNARKYYEPRDAGERIIKLIREEDPDILCIQEFNRTFAPDLEYYKDWFTTPVSSSKSNQAIYSKYPIVQFGAVSFPDSNNAGIFADIRYKGDTLRVYSVHLQSYKIRSRNFLYRNYGLDFFMRLNGVSQKHREQARLVKEHVSNSPYKTVLCGDFNATAFSRSYRIISKGLQDSFREQGSGWGTTYYLNQILPYRIDFILASEDLEVRSYRKRKERWSDHLPIMVTLQTEMD